MDSDQRSVGRVVVGGGGDRIYVEDHGGPDRPAVVLLHGLSFCRLAWQHQVCSELRSQFRLVTVDLRGHGGSDAPPDGYADPVRWAADVDAVLDGLDLVRPVLVGWSYGGTVICDYLAHRHALTGSPGSPGTPGTPGATGTPGSAGSVARPDRELAGVVLVGAVSDLGTQRALDGLGAEFLAVTRRLVRCDPDDLPAAIGEFVDLCAHRPLPAADLARFHGWSAVVPAHVRSGLLRRRVEHDATLRAVRAPTLVLHGEHDRVVLPAHARHVAGLPPDSRLVCVPGVGHMPFWEAPELFNAELAGFVRDVTGG